MALDYAHKIGLQFHGTYRVAGFHFPVPEDEWNAGGAYDKHPEWRGQDRAGRPTPRLSYAHPEVRRMAIGFLKEMAQYPIDGICLAYNRRPPLVEYEAPIVEGLRAKFGEDPRRIEERDPRWLSYRATFVDWFEDNSSAGYDIAGLREACIAIDAAFRNTTSITSEKKR